MMLIQYLQTDIRTIKKKHKLKSETIPCQKTLQRERMPETSSQGNAYDTCVG